MRGQKQWALSLVGLSCGIHRKLILEPCSVGAQMLFIHWHTFACNSHASSQLRPIISRLLLTPVVLCCGTAYEQFWAMCCGKQRTGKSSNDVQFVLNFCQLYVPTAWWHLYVWILSFKQLPVLKLAVDLENKSCLCLDGWEQACFIETKDAILIGWQDWLHGKLPWISSTNPFFLPVISLHPVLSWKRLLLKEIPI